MTGREYLDAVSAELKRLTPSERAAVRAELAAHMEDHAAALTDCGYDAAEAETLAAEQMGDPAETGRAIARLYRPFWLWAERVARVLVVLLCVHCALNVVSLGGVFGSIRARSCKPEESSAVALDECMEFGNDVVRLYGVCRYQEDSEDGVELFLCAYDRLPTGVVDQNIWTWLTATGNGGERTRYAGGSGWSNANVTYRRLRVPLEADDALLTLRCERFGDAAELTIDLTEVLP